MAPRTALVLGATVSLGGCTAHFVSTTKVDGVAFAPISCMSGQRAGFPGLEFVGATGERLRVEQHLDGSATIAYYPAGSRVGEQMPGCTTIDAHSGVGVVNGVRNLDGTITLACLTDHHHQITGALQFENCH